MERSRSLEHDWNNTSIAYQESRQRALKIKDQGNNVGVCLSSSVVKATCSYFKLKDIFKASINDLKKAMNIQDTLSHAQINKIFLKEHRVYDFKQIKLKIYVEGDC
ncbi:hypothetical protein Tco_0837046 [Tanacetum coccineum]